MPPKKTKREDLVRYQEALERSGYLLEARVSDFLQEAGWVTTNNSLVIDPKGGEVGELDVRATKATRGPGERKDYIAATIVAECVNNLFPLVFFDSDQRNKVFHTLHWRYGGFPERVGADAPRAKNSLLSPILAAIGTHHYCEGPFATQYCSFSEKRDGKGATTLMASHHESHYEALAALPVAVDAQQVAARAHARSFANKNAAHLTFVYPLLVLSGSLFRGKATRKGVRLTRVNHMQLLYRCRRGKETESYLIDVVNETGLKALLPILLAEVQKVADAIAADPSEIESAFQERTNF